MTPQNSKRLKTARRRDVFRGAAVVIVMVVLCGYFVSSCTKAPEPIDDGTGPYKPPLIEDVTSSDPMTNVDFSDFMHDGPRHQNLPCLLCHQRNDESTKVGFAPHVACAGCHTPQFDDSSHPICLVCHEAQGSAKLKPFPPIRSFKVKFDHQSHFKEANCATCHKQQGTGMSVPNREDAHMTCFQCHTALKTVGENNIGKCSTCHELGPRNPFEDSTAAIGFNFDHSKHGGLDCKSCHNPQAGNDMSAINVAMHSNSANSCATCHNGARAFGANNFSNCRQCHSEIGGAKSFGIKFSHSNHTKAKCSVCHKPAGKTGNFVVPDGQAAHTTCWQCHSPNKGGGNFMNGKCFTCHQPGGTNTIAASSPVIRGNFAHTKHGFMDCDACHSPADGKMSAPVVLMHKAPKSGTNCATCHNNEVAFGEDFTNCKKCHVGNKFTN
jgi:c(7)-type cytochrome triheme protein